MANRYILVETLLTPPVGAQEQATNTDLGVPAADRIRGFSASFGFSIDAPLNGHPFPGTRVPLVIPFKQRPNE